MKKGLCCFGILLAVGFGANASAQNAPANAPPFYGVKEMRLQYPRLGNPDATSKCGLSSQELMTLILKGLTTLGLPVFSVVDAPPFKPEVARVDLFPDVVTLQPQEAICISWVSLTAQSNEIINLPPVEVPRSVLVTYFSSGMMFGGSVNGHANAIKDTIDKLGAQLVKQYRNDQPPELAPPAELMPTKTTAP